MVVYGLAVGPAQIWNCPTLFTVISESFKEGWIGWIDIAATALVTTVRQGTLEDMAAQPGVQEWWIIVKTGHSRLDNTHREPDQNKKNIPVSCPAHLWYEEESLIFCTTKTPSSPTDASIDESWLLPSPEVHRLALTLFTRPL